MMGPYTCSACGDGIEGDEYLVHQMDGEYDVYHVWCWDREAT